MIKIGAKVIRHVKYVTFQMAEVAIPRSLFALILDKIASCGRCLKLVKMDGTLKVMESTNLMERPVFKSREKVIAWAKCRYRGPWRQKGSVRDWSS
jgi:hypothetical protein